MTDNTKNPETLKLIILGLIIGLALGAVIGGLYTSRGTDNKVDEIKSLTLDFVNQNLLPPGVTADVKNVVLKGGFYEVELSINTPQGIQETIVYVSNDGLSLFVNPPIDLTSPYLKPPQATQPPQPSVNIEINMAELVDDDPSSGNPDAKVVVVEFSDFQCPFCERAAATVSQIRETYGDQILFVYRDFPITSIHPDAQKAAEAAQCAYDQDKFWEYHDVLFENRMSWSGVGVPKFKEYAMDLGLDTTAFDECLDTGKYTDEVLDDINAGTQLGVTGTPTFFINGRKLVGAQPFENFKKLIDQELEATS